MEKRERERERVRERDRERVESGNHGVRVCRTTTAKENSDVP